MAEKRFSEARAVLDKMANLNGRPHFQYSFEGEEGDGDSDGVRKRRRRNVGVFKHEVIMEQNDVAAA